MKALFVLILSFNAFALTPAHLNMPINRAYMQNIVADYFKWHERHFKSDLFKLTGSHRSLIERALKRLDHWKVPETNLDQFLVGMKIKDGQPFYSVRLYLHADLRGESELKNIWFIQWDSMGEWCLIEKRNDDFRHICQKDRRAITSKVFPAGEAQWPQPFQEFSGETIKTYLDGQLADVFYHVKLTHLSRVPQSYHHYLNTHGQELLLPFDKYSTNKKNELTVYYP